MKTLKEKWNEFAGKKHNVVSKEATAPVEESNTSLPVKHLNPVEQRLSGPDAAFWRRVYDKGEFAKPITVRNIKLT